MALRLSITSDYKQYQRKLQRVQGAFAETMARTLNITAHAVDNKSGRNLRSMMILRNQYTLRSLRVADARVKKSGGTGYAEVGSISPYLPIQETGGVRRASRRKLPIPTTAIRLGRSKRGVIMTKFRLSRVGDIITPSENRRKPRGGSRMFFAPFRRPGFYFRSGKRLIMARDLSFRSVRVKPTRWHSAAVKQFGQRRVMEAVFVREAKKKLGMIR